jgi:tetratricopeptide (TPR) repeat protein
MMGADQQYQIAITNELIEDYNNANSLYDQGRLEDAKAAYKRCIERDRYFAPAHLSLGAVYEAQRDMPVAVKCYQNAVRADPAGEAGRFARENLRRLRGY